MADIKQYRIVINGLQESIDAVDALNKQLDALDKRISALQAKSINIGGTTSTGGTGKSSRASALSEEEKLLRQIEQTENKIKAYSQDVYQNYMASKEQLKETLNDQKQIAAQERLQANTYSNTMKGLKQQLADIKQVMQTTEIGSDIFKKYTAEANEITNKLKELEEAYGQFGRNVGNYKSAAEGFNKIRVVVGDTTREFDNYRQAIKALRGEQFQLSQTLGQESKEYKDVHNAIKQLESAYKDLSVSSKFMDNMLDSMTTITAAANVGVGLSNFFGIDDADFEDAMRKLVGLSQALQGLEVLRQQWQADDSWLLKPFKILSSKIGDLFKPVSDFFNNLPNRIVNKVGVGYEKNLEKRFSEIFDKVGRNAATDSLVKRFLEKSKNKDEEYLRQYEKQLRAKFSKMSDDSFKDLFVFVNKADVIKNNLGEISKSFSLIRNGIKAVGVALRAVFSAGILLFLPEIIQYVTDFIKSLDKTKVAAEQAGKALNALNRSLEKRMDMLGSSYLKGQISSEEYLKKVYDEQTTAIDKQIDLLKQRADAAKDNGVLGLGWFTQSENADFSGNRMTGETTVKSGMFNQLGVTVKNIEEVEKAWRKANQAIKEGKDYIDKWGEDDTWYQRLMKEWQSIFATVGQTEDVLKGMGNIKLSDTIAQFQEVTNQLNEGKITTDQYAKEMAKLRDAMNDNEILNSVIANLDKYIPDEEVREQVQNIINKIYELDDAFNMTSPQQIHHWNQVRIDAMKDGLKKTLAQIQENERYEIQQEAKTDEQRKLIEAKYQRQRLDAQEKAGKESLAKQKEINKKMQDAENQLIALRIANMKDGFDKRMKELDNQKRLELQKLTNDAKDNKYIKVQEMALEINKKYDKLILDEKRKWAYDMLKTYEDLAERINQLNKATFDIEISNANQNVDNRTRRGESETGYQMITPTNYDDSKNLEEYYRKIVDIKKKAAEREFAIEQERLDKQLEYDKKEEELRHKRLLDENGGEYITQLRAGLITQEEYDKLIEDENDAHYARMNALDKQYASNLSAATQDSLEKTQKLYSDFYGNIINNLRRDKSKIDEIMSKQPVTDTAGWGVVNIGKTNQNYTNALAEYDKIKQEILKKQSELEQDLKNHNISAEDFAIRQEDLKNEIKAINEACKSVKESQKMLIADFLQSMQQYIQAGMESFNTIMQAIWEAQDNQFDKEQEQLDKLNETLDKKLDEQQEIVEKHKSAIDSIEDELATARGDRRQHLIDQLNAEMAAQREAQKQEQKIQKEKEAAQKKQDALELKRKKAQYKRDMLQAIVNGAMAVTMAAINSWPIPAIPMMALAGATTAAQIAIMSANRPYESGGRLDGGVASGPRHKDGGIPVLGGRASIEGGEFITNRWTTSKNVDLLDYINSKKKRIGLSDMLEFYGNDIKKNVKSISPKRVFADGGVIPSLSTDININDRLISAMEAYAQRPYYVTVTDIENRMNQVKYVRTLAGVGENN